MKERKNEGSIPETLGTLMQMAGCAGIGAALGAANFFFEFSLKPKKHDKRRDTEPGQAEYYAGRRWMNEHPDRRDVYTLSDNGLRLHGNLIPAKEAACHRYAICVHGYADSAESMGVYARHYAEQWGMHVLLPDLRGHGESEGSYVGMGYPDHFDLIRWIDYILEKDGQAVIVLHGISMGAATVMMTTGETLPAQVAAAVEDAGYTSAEEEFTHVYEGLDGAFIPAPVMMQLVRLICIVRAHFDLNKAAPLRYVRRSHTPTLFVHGEDDDFVPASMMPRLYEAASCRKDYLWVPGAEHVRSVVVDPEGYWTKVRGFLQKFAPQTLPE